MITVIEKTLRIERFAKELGFDGFGVAREVSAKSVEKYKNWLS